MTTIIAHAGCEGTPPNSLSYIRTAIAAGVDAVEFDLRLGGERVLLSHDPLEREKLADYLTLEDAAALARGAELRFEGAGGFRPCASNAPSYGDGAVHGFYRQLSVARRICGRCARLLYQYRSHRPCRRGRLCHS